MKRVGHGYRSIQASIMSIIPAEDRYLIVFGPASAGLYTLMLYLSACPATTIDVGV